MRWDLTHFGEQHFLMPNLSFSDCTSTSEAFARALDPILAPMGAAVAEPLRNLLTQFVADQHDLLVLGKYNASAPQPRNDAAYAKLNGIGVFLGAVDVGVLGALRFSSLFSLTHSLPGRLGHVCGAGGHVQPGRRDAARQAAV